MDSTPSRAARNRLSCSECQRRKQKCNREWPCNHCLKRKVADKCRFALPAANAPAEASTALDSRKRQASPDEAHKNVISSDFPPGSLGYNAPDDKQYWTDAAPCPALARALKEFPKRHWVDSLLRIFFQDINNQFYILYPAAFFHEYQVWWTRVEEKRPLALQFTALLFTVCACSIQHADQSLKAVLERDMGDIESLSEKYHSLARELGSVVPPGYSHLHSCQSMLHSSYWYISQGKYSEAWHALSAAARECQTLVKEKDAAFHQLPSFEREMRRRLWCIIQILDWQISAGLARATIVNWSAVEVVLPSLTMEAFSPSPMLHMKIQSQLISQLAATYPNDKTNMELSTIRQYQSTVEAWAKAFPRVYAFENPDTLKDAANPWIIFNRFYLYTMAYFLLLASFRPVMLKGYTFALSEEERGVCFDGIRYCVKNMRVAVLWADHVDRHGGGYHFMIGSAFDTAVLLCTCIMKDAENSMTKEAEIYEELDNAVSLFARLAHTSSIAKFASDTAAQLVSKLQRPNAVRKAQKRRKVNINAVSPAPIVEAGRLVPSPALVEGVGSETSSEQLNRDDLTPESISDDWQGSIDSVRGNTSLSNSEASLGAIDDSLSPWPMESYDEATAQGGTVTLSDGFQLILEEQAADDLADQAVNVDDFASLWDWEALGLGTYPLGRHPEFEIEHGLATQDMRNLHSVTNDDDA
ncbi:putative transcription factor sol4 [Beauveria bassiana]|nr:putative transcription factor sol4 [Beauveria bassiana]